MAPVSGRDCKKTKEHGNESIKSVAAITDPTAMIAKVSRLLIVSHAVTLLIWLTLMLAGAAMSASVMAGGFLIAVVNAAAAVWYSQCLQQSGSGGQEMGEQTAATQDPLAQLPNHRSFLHHLDLVIRRSSRAHVKFALLMFDTGDCSETSKRYDGEVGDELRRQLVKRLAARIRITDGLARWGDDQFAMILENISTRRDIEKLVSGMLHELSQPITIGNDELVINARVGAAVYPDHSADGTALMSDAYEAMCYARDVHSENYYLYDPVALSTKEVPSTC